MRAKQVRERRGVRAPSGALKHTGPVRFAFLKDDIVQSRRVCVLAAVRCYKTASSHPLHARAPSGVPARLLACSRAVPTKLTCILPGCPVRADCPRRRLCGLWRAGARRVPGRDDDAAGPEAGPAATGPAASRPSRPRRPLSLQGRLLALLCLQNSRHEQHGGHCEMHGGAPR